MTARSVSIAKISRPRMSGVMPRERLFRLLDKCRERPVVWVSGPAGAGKTTLIASYLDAHRLPCLWYSVDQSDSDIASFFYYLGLATKKAAPSKRKPLPLLTPEYLMGVPAFTLRYFEVLYNRLKPPFAVVLDNFQDVQDAPPFHEVIGAGLSMIPEGITVIILSRNEPPASCARLLAGSRIGFLRWEDIRFTIEESSELVRLREKRTISDEALSLLYRKTEGWAAGLVLFLESINAGNMDYASLGKLAPQEIFGYFARELFDRTDAETREFLLETALLPKMTAQMAGDLTGNQRAGHILSELHRDNFFTHQHATTVQMYHYHPLFREFLNARAVETFRPERLAGIRKKAAEVLEKSGQGESAIALFRAAGERLEEARLILTQAQDMVAQGRWQTLQSWIEALPRQIIDQDPRLLYWGGVCRLPFSPPTARECFIKAFHLCEKEKEPVGTLFALCGIIDSYFYEWDDFKPLDQWLDRIDELQRDNPVFPSIDIEVQTAISVVRASVYRRPQHAGTGPWVERMLKAVQRHPDVNQRIAAQVHASTYYFWMGERAKDIQAYEEARRMSHLPVVSPFTYFLWKGLEVSKHWIMSLPGSVDQLVSDSLEQTRTSGIRLFDYWFYALGATEALSRGKLDKADHYLENIGSVITNYRRVSVGHYHFLAAWRHLLGGDIAQASALVEKALQITVETGILFFETITRILYAHVLQTRGDQKAADGQLSAAATIVSATKSSLLEWVHLLCRAWFSLERGEEKQALSFLSSAMGLGRKKGIMMHEGWLPPVMTRLCIKALEKGIEVEYVQDLVRTNKLIPDTPPYEYENWPWAVKVFTLGRSEIFRDGKPVRFSKKVPKKPIELLRLLIAFGGQNVSETRVNDVLWPDADGDAAHKNFGMALVRLRELLGLKEAVHLKEGSVTLDKRYFWVDAWAFEDIIEKIETARGQGKARTVSDLMEKAIDLYRGPFLQDENGHWAISLRERLRGKFLNQIKKTGAYWEEKKEFLKAIDCYQKGLEIDDLFEEFYQRIILCYLRLSRRAEAVSTYRQCEKILKSCGIKPSPETESIYNSLNSEKK